MGAGNSKVPSHLTEADPSERYFGFENFGNTCYANSVVQSLFFCRAFRDRLLAYAKDLPPDAEESLLNTLALLFKEITDQKKSMGVIAPRRFMAVLRRENAMFDSPTHQDAQEFIIFLLNEISETLEKQEKQRRDHLYGSSDTGSSSSGGGSPGGTAAMQGARSTAACSTGTADPAGTSPRRTWVQELFQGKYVNQTKCLRCETVTSREEVFFDMSLEIEHNTSVSRCLRNFSSTETLNAEDKFSCDACGCLQEAQKCMKVKELPQVLCLHLKRFKYMGDMHRLRKLMYRVVFPFELKLCNTADDCEAADCAYNLFAIVVHIGSGMHHGHYVAIVKVQGYWILYDDDHVKMVDEATVYASFGSSHDGSTHAEHGYLLLYQKQSDSDRTSTSPNRTAANGESM